MTRAGSPTRARSNRLTTRSAARPPSRSAQEPASFDARKAILALASFLALTSSPAGAELRRIPADDFEPSLRLAFAEANPKDVISLPAGEYFLNRSLTLAIPDVAIRGAGIDQTRLNFSQQESGAQSLLILSDGVEISNLRLVDPPADGVVARGVKRLRIDRVGVEWRGAPSASNGAYGIYPVLSYDVAISRCEVSGASEAGIYLGQSERGRIIDNLAARNVIGIDVENSTDAIVESNRLSGNAVGIVVSARPGLPRTKTSRVSVRSNRVATNNLVNFAAPGSYAASLLNGSGVVVVGGSFTQVGRNVISGHDRAGILLLNYTSLGLGDGRAPNFSPNMVETRLAENEFPEQSTGASFNGDSWRDARGFEVVWDGVTSPWPVRREAQFRALCRDHQDVDNFLVASPGARSADFRSVVEPCDSAGESD